MSKHEQALCTATARWLWACSRTLGAAGLGAAGLAALLLMQRAALSPLPAAVLLLALVERVLAMRCTFDAGLFADLGGQDIYAAGDANGAIAVRRLAALDDALVTLRLRKPAAHTRPLADRVAGARRLTLQHAAVVLMQCSGLAMCLYLLQGRAA